MSRNVFISLAAAVLPLTFAWGAVAGGDLPPRADTDGPSCDIRIAKEGGSLVLEGLVFAPSPVAGSYELEISQGGYAGSSAFARAATSRSPPARTARSASSLCPREAAMPPRSSFIGTTAPPTAHATSAPGGGSRALRILGDTTMITNTLKAGLVAAAIAVAATAATPASAGSFTFTLTPRGDSADLIKSGLQIYGLVNEFKGKNHAKVDQKGRNNAAAISQKGQGNYGLVYQRGKGHEATLTQAGRNNAFGIFQFGKATNADVVQTGRGDVGLVFQGGW